MAALGDSTLSKQARSWSLRREWTRAFMLMLALVLATGVCTVIGVVKLVGQFSGVADQRDRETSAVAALRGSLVDHEQVGHLLLHGESVDRDAFIRQQSEILLRFDHTTAIFPAGNGTHQILDRARENWQQSLTTAHLWGRDQVMAVTGSHEKVSQTFGADSDAARGVLDELDAPSLRAMHEGLADGRALERYMIVFLGALFALALAVTGHFRRRMTKDLYRPLAAMHDGVLKVRSGDLDHQIEVVRNDELGELAAAFNGMAEALRDKHRALTRQATRDALTGLANRAALGEHLAGAFHPDGERTSACGSLLFIDVDDFKDVNDSLGHEAGDALLIELVGRLAACISPDDLLARLGGDEFAIVVAQTGAPRGGSDVAEAILTALEQPVAVNDIRLTVSVSIGVAERRAETTDPAELLRQADFAMYMAKGGGKSRYQVFDALMHDTMVGRAALKADLADAVSGDQLLLEYQPVVDLDTGRVIGVEALVRWQHPTLGLLAPNEFIPLAEESGDIEAIGCWVLRTSIQQNAQWRRSIAGCADLWVSVNLSTFQLPNPKSLAEIQYILVHEAPQTGALILEVTETALAHNLSGGIAVLNTLRDCGARIAIDDFGTGFSSLSTLAHLPVDILKIDQSFVSGQDGSAPSVPILEGIIELARKLSLKVIAEGIEQPDQVTLLRRLGCPYGQGNLLARPASAQQVSAFLAASEPLYGQPVLSNNP